MNMMSITDILNLAKPSSLNFKDEQKKNNDLRIEWQRVHILDEVPHEHEILSKASGAEYQINSGKYEEALNICKSLTTELPKWSRGWILLGDALWKKLEKKNSKEILEEAKVAYNHANMICSQDPYVQRGLGKINFSEKKFNIALQYFNLAKENKLTDPDMLQEIIQWISACEPTSASKNWVKA